MMKPVEIWEEFRRRVLPGISEIQTSEMKKAFLAGMRAGVTEVLELANDATADEDAQVAYLAEFDRAIDVACLASIAEAMGGTH